MSAIRTWTPEEFLSRPPEEVIEQSEQLSKAMRKLLFGKHPAAQLMCLVEMSAQWVHNHQPDQHRKEAYDLFKTALEECVEKGFK